MSFRSFSFLMISLGSISAHAQAPIPPELAPETVTESNIRLVGRGIAEDGTGNGIVMACSGPKIGESQIPSCNVLRAVLFDSVEKSAVYMGPAVVLKDPRLGEISKSELNASIKQMNRQYKEFVIEKREIGINLKRAGVLWTGIIGGCYAVGMGTLWVIAPVGAVVVFGIVIGDRPFMSGGGKVTTAVQDQNGWNWSSHPRSVSAKKFVDFKQYMERGLARKLFAQS